MKINKNPFILVKDELQDSYLIYFSGIYFFSVNLFKVLNFWFFSFKRKEQEKIKYLVIKMEGAVP